MVIWLRPRCLLHSENYISDRTSNVYTYIVTSLKRIKIKLIKILSFLRVFFLQGWGCCLAKMFALVFHNMLWENLN